MLRLFYAMALCCLLILSSEAYAATAVGSVVTVSGDAQVERAGKRVAITLHQAVFQNDTIITGAKGRVKLIMIDKSKVYIGSRTKISLSKYTVGDKGFIQASLDMVWGKARFFVNKLVSRKSSFEVRTSTAVLGVRGTGWLTEVVNGQTFVTQFEGVLSVQTAHGTFSVQHGQVASIDSRGVFSVRPATRGEMSRQKIDPDIGDNAMAGNDGQASSDNEKKGKDQNADKPQGDKPQGDKPQGDKPQGDKPQGDKPQGDKPQADKLQADKLQADKSQGNKPQASSTQGSNPQASSSTQVSQPKTSSNQGSSGNVKSNTTVNVAPVVVPQRETAVLVPKGFTPASATNVGGGSGTATTGTSQQNNNNGSGQSKPAPASAPPPAPTPPPVVIQNATQQAQTAVRIQPSFVLP